MFRPENRRSKKKKSKISNRLSFSRENFPSVTSPSSSKTNREGRFNYSVTVQLSMIFSTAAINETLHNGTLQRVTRVGNTHFLRCVVHSFPRIWIGATYVSRRIKIPRFNVTHHRAEGVRRDEVCISCVTNRSTKSIFLIGISSTASLAVTLRYLIPPQLDIYIVHLRVIIIAVRFPIRIEQMYSFERVFFSVHKTTKETTFKMEKRKETDI